MAVSTKREGRGRAPVRLGHGTRRADRRAAGGAPARGRHSAAHHAPDRARDRRGGGLAEASRAARPPAGGRVRGRGARRLFGRRGLHPGAHAPRASAPFGRLLGNRRSDHDRDAREPGRRLWGGWLADRGRAVDGGGARRIRDGRQSGGARSAETTLRAGPTPGDEGDAHRMRRPRGRWAHEGEIRGRAVPS